MKATRRFRPVVLCILDGWGHRNEREDNAIAQARTPVWDRLVATCPHSLLEASNADVGLPDGQMGNSEVGHMNIGAGRVVMQNLPRIDRAVADGSLAANPTLEAFIDALSESGGACHLMGLMSPGGVHSHQRHIAALARAVAGRGVPVAVHAFLDGRDTPPSSAPDYLDEFKADIAGVAGARIVTVSGRYYAMDRDKRWQRVARAYDALVSAQGESATDADAAVAGGYARGETDEFVAPTVVGGYAGMNDGDGILMANFRADRVREILAALLDPAFEGFARERTVAFAAACGMTEYAAELNEFLTTLFPPERPARSLGEVVAEAGMTQLRIAETEKYAHVTFFLNGGEERLFPGEERILVPSPRVATYDLEPEMSAVEVTDRLVEAVAGGRFDLIVVNYANGDMVGHTGKLDAAIRAAETVDACLGRLADAVDAAGGALIITSDHGNAEMMRDPASDQPHTAHTSNPVPFIVVGASEATVRDGRLADVAPTVLDLLGLPRPEEMTAESLLAPAPPAKAGVRHAHA
ncbi:MAG: 2,3-bisphosphoglycerate-independent phosphoglycerate mutase [Proteobacteria bacterium]|nr:2,3-bisphosphoglycerate-independent phosphoglycerate mutase [Pseudomonadota bacterium]